MGRTPCADAPVATTRRLIPTRNERITGVRGCACHPGEGRDPSYVVPGYCCELGPRPAPGRPYSCRSDASLGGAADLAVPAFEQALALGRRAVLGEVVIDELDVGRFRRQ